MTNSPCILASFLLCVGIPAIPSLCAQTPQATPTQAKSAEVTTAKDAPVTFKSGVNLVPVPVVVRDSKGHAVGDLGVNDFQLFDNGKPQMISKFIVEKLAPGDGAVTPPAVTSPVVTTLKGGFGADAKSDGIPDRFVAYLFDDLHLSPADLVYTRDAAKRQIDSPTHARERAAIYTTSGQAQQDFSGDREKLHSALAAIGTGNATATKTRQQNACPPMTYYVGDLITNKSDRDALAMAAADAMKCAQLPKYEMAVGMARQAAREALNEGDRDTLASLETLNNLVKRMAAMPGQRTIVLISPGFLVLEDRREAQTAIIERAIRSNVVIGALDARGLFVSTMLADASQANVNTHTLVQKDSYANMESIVQGDVMASLAEGTGGTFYHGLNDYDEGIARTAAAPEYLYVLGFSPLDLKLDGKYHNLKVTLKSAKGIDLQVRKGYYAPRYAADPAEQAKQQVKEAFFSRDEVHDLPAVLQAQYFKTGDNDATLSAVAKVDVKKLNLRKEDGRNLDNLTVITGLFDNDGNYISGVQKTVELRLLDDTLDKRVGSGIAVSSSFAVRTGRYVVRMLVRDSEGQLMATESAPVEIR